MSDLLRALFRGIHVRSALDANRIVLQVYRHLDLRVSTYAPVTFPPCNGLLCAGLAAAVHFQAMDFAGMDRVLDQLTAEELGAVLRMIAALEGRGMPLGDADDCRLRLLARQRFLELDGTATADA